MLRKQQQLQPPSPETQELLAQLHDIQEPPPVSWWPPAPGWWLLALLIFAFLLGLTLWLHRKKKQAERNRYRKEAVALLETINTQKPEAAEEINEILKRVAVTTFSRARCGNLTGNAWLKFLQNSALLEPPHQVHAVLLEELYRGTSEPESSQVFCQYAIQWVQQHQYSEQAPAPRVDKEPASV
ncbi:DUF4381 domain-containing protein [Microbulbifer echini]|uniref:DUF4381 domain-containing protein n=1 Tax=Microbulbifer echini TaxID=1529067 RepID=A0ABV4NRD5_9GAMM|nr:DUF4381 domain-containing protein [uncultured Microbulbifer sp.]